MDDGTRQGAPGQPIEGLRERKKRQMRQLISDTATSMFLERGYDEVKVTEVAERCGISEKTVYNYFPTKESLILDREEEMAVAIRAALGPGAPARSPTEAAIEVLKADLEDMRADWDVMGPSIPTIQRFNELIETTPSLRAAQRDMMDRLVQVAAEAMAERAGMSPDEPEPQVAAGSLLALWRIQYQAMVAYAAPGRPFDEVYEDVISDVARAARLVDSGLWSFDVMVRGRGTRDQVKAAAEAAQAAGRQVASALKEARNVWRQVQMEAHQREPHDPRDSGPPWGAGGPWGAGLWGRQDHPGHHRPRDSFGRDLEEWKQARRDLKQRFFEAKREQQRLLREAMRRRQEEERQRRRQRGR